MIQIAESISPLEPGIANMANIVKILGESTQVNAGLGTTVPGGDGVGAKYAMVQHSHSSDRLVEVRTGAGVTYGSFHMAGNNPLIIRKEHTDLIYSSGADVYATNVAPFG